MEENHILNDQEPTVLDILTTSIMFIDDSLERYHRKKDLRECLQNLRAVLSLGLEPKGPAAR